MPFDPDDIRLRESRALAAALTDGDGTDRNVWVISNGASDPADASPEDIIFEKQ